jgi:hypothetical protein
MCIVGSPPPPNHVVYSKFVVKIIRPVLPISLSFLLKLVRYHEIRPLFRKLYFLTSEYFYLWIIRPEFLYLCTCGGAPSVPTVFPASTVTWPIIPHICCTYVDTRLSLPSLKSGLPAGLVQGRFSENRPFWKKFGLGKLPALWPALSRWEALNVLKRYRKKIFHKPIIFTAVKVLWQTF